MSSTPRKVPTIIMEHTFVNMANLFNPQFHTSLPNRDGIPVPRNELTTPEQAPDSRVRNAGTDGSLTLERSDPCNLHVESLWA